MKFLYRQVAPKIIRPIIPITVQYRDKIVPYTAVIDSGADYCIFDMEVAKLLGLKFHPMDKVEFFGVGGKQKGYWGKVTLRIGDEFYTQKVVFSDLKKSGFGILGQTGFFDHFTALLDYKSQSIIIQPYDRSSPQAADSTGK
jgi:hypothetical protein